MSAQGATLGRGSVRLPTWPVAALVAAAAAVTIGVTMIDGPRQASSEPFAPIGRGANSTTALREAGVALPTIDLTNSGVAVRNRGFAIPELVFESTTAIREQGVALPVIVGISHVAPSLHASASVGYSGLENPGGYIPQTSAYPSGLENPTAYGMAGEYSPPQGGVAPQAEFTPTVTWHRPVI